MKKEVNEKKGLLQNDATAPKTMGILHPVDVGAANGRPYEFYRKISVFCNRSFYRSYFSRYSTKPRVR